MTLKYKFLAITLLCASLMTAASCGDWTEIENAEIDLQGAKDQNPKLWADYMDALKAYKQSPHYISYASFDNGTNAAVNEGNYLRSLPDSLDIVSLRNPDKISACDREDIIILHEKGTKALYCIDYEAKIKDLSDASKLGAYLDKAIAEAKELGTDGFAFTGSPLYGGDDAELSARKEAAKLIVSSLSAALGNGLLVFEGDPSFVDSGDISKLDYVVLPTAGLARVSDVELMVATVPENTGLTKDQLLLGVEIGGTITNEVNAKKNALLELTDRVASLGPLAGVCIYSITDDYYHSTANYENTRASIQLMNPSK